MKNFAEQILKRYESHQRDLPWRHTKDPYKIWLSEIIMQQTQIIQGTSYYLAFIEKFPTVTELANADEQEILVLWQGLGYYSRARNLHFTAKQIVENNKGIFPDSFEDLIKLKGIGDYTASAISSICFNEVRAAIDGNVLRVISRLFEIYDPINKAQGLKKVKQKVEQLISEERPGDFNQALMDFGSQVCKAKNPRCGDCIFSEHCLAYKHSVIHKLPFKEKGKAKTKEFISYFICVHHEKEALIVRQRTEGIWKNLYEFPKIKDRFVKEDFVLINRFSDDYKVYDNVNIKAQSDEFRHLLSHKELYIRFFILDISERDFTKIISDHEYEELSIKDLNKFPFPIVLRKYLDKKFPIV